MLDRKSLKFPFAAVLLLCAAVVSADAPPRFPAGSVWHQRIDDAPLHPDSASMIDTLDGLGGWGPAGGVDHRMHIDFSFHVRRMAADEIAPLFPVVGHKAYDGDYYLPDCEPLGIRMPVPADAAFEGETGQTCGNDAADCHLIVEQAGLLYELFSGNLADNELDALCLAVWDLNVVYPPEGRGEHCTSADAAGFPIAPLMPSPDGVQAAIDAGSDSDLGHAIRFILPNARMATDASLGGVDGRLYVRPATHAGGPTGPVDTVPYGARLRLRADFPTAGYNAAARVILRTMQRYGIVLSDGGNIALTFASDRHNGTTWSTLGITPQIFWNGSEGDRTPIRVTDFAVVDTGARIGETFDCVRTDIVPGAALFEDGFESLQQ